MENQIAENTIQTEPVETDYSTETHEKLLGFLIGWELILAEKILEVLEGNNDLTNFENDYWASKGSIAHYQSRLDSNALQILITAKLTNVQELPDNSN